LPQLVDDGSTSYVDAAGSLVGQIGHTGTVSYPLGDALGSVRQITDSTGAVVGNSAYDVYGGVRTQSGVSSVFGFTGQQTDPTGLLFLRARYLDPTLGRFLSSDAVQPNSPGTQGFNPYAYVAGRPTTAIDPDGHMALVEYVQNVWRNATALLRATIPLSDGYTKAQLAECIILASAAAVTPAAAPIPGPCAKAGVLIRYFLLLLLALSVATIPSDKQQPGTGPAPPGGTPAPPDNRRRGCGSASLQDVDYLKARAVEVVALKDNFYQTVADLRTYEPSSKLCIDIVGGGKRNLNEAQRANVLAHNEIPVTMADRHAEVTVLNHMLPSTIPVLMGMSQPACQPTDTFSDTCRRDIQDHGGSLTTDQQGATFPGNIAIMLAGG
jgi:RHS repeat-associated protein